MEAQALIQLVKEDYHEAGLDTLEVWYGQLSGLYALTAEHLGEVKKNRALREIEIKSQMLHEGGKPTEKAIERAYYATTEGQYLAYNQECLKAIGRLVQAVKFKIEALRGAYG
jgi:hypothetical protein